MVEIIGEEPAASCATSRSRSTRRRATTRRRAASSSPTPSSSSASIDGEVTLVDEVLTPDSSRFWPADDLRARHEPAQLRQAVRARLARGERLGQDAAARRRFPPTCRRSDLGEVHPGVRAHHRPHVRSRREGRTTAWHDAARTNARYQKYTGPDGQDPQVSAPPPSRSARRRSSSSAASKPKAKQRSAVGARRKCAEPDDAGVQALAPAVVDRPDRRWRSSCCVASRIVPALAAHPHGAVRRGSAHRHARPGVRVRSSARSTSTARRCASCAGAGEVRASKPPADKQPTAGDAEQATVERRPEPADRKDADAWRATRSS